MRAMIAAFAIATIAPALQAAAGDTAFRDADHNGAAELARGDYAKAGRVLAASLKIAPNAADLLLNQAQLDLRNGRTAAARAGYARVLAQPDEPMLLAGERWQGSHALARAGLLRVDTRVAGR